jgi:hypothetical protein
MRQTDRQRFSASQTHESTVIIFMDIYKECQLKKVKTKQSAASLQSSI